MTDNYYAEYNPIYGAFTIFRDGGILAVRYDDGGWGTGSGLAVCFPTMAAADEYISSKLAQA